MRSRRRRHPQPRPHRASPQSAWGGILKMFLCDTPEQAWVYINRVVEPPSRNLATLLSQHPVEKVAYGIYTKNLGLGQFLGNPLRAEIGCGNRKTWTPWRASGPGSSHRKVLSGQISTGLFASSEIVMHPQRLTAKQSRLCACGCAADP